MSEDIPPAPAIPADKNTEPTVAYTGDEFALGAEGGGWRGGHFGIWDAEGKELQRFPGNDAGWNKAWQTFIQLEPDAERIRTAAADKPDTLEPLVESRHRHGASWAMRTALVLVSFLLLAVVVGGVIWASNLNERLDRTNALLIANRRALSAVTA